MCHGSGSCRIGVVDDTKFFSDPTHAACKVVLHVIVLGVTSRFSQHDFLQIENIEVLG
jgi:hypothetical protein